MWLSFAMLCLQKSLCDLFLIEDHLLLYVYIVLKNSTKGLDNENELFLFRELSRTINEQSYLSCTIKVGDYHFSGAFSRFY